LRVRTALISAIYRKSLRLSNTAKKEMTVGETTNLMQIDTQRFMDLCLWLNLAWACPLQIVLAMYFLWQVLGPASLAGRVLHTGPFFSLLTILRLGLAVMILLIPLNAVIAANMRRLQLAQMKQKDKRTKIMDEILTGIKILKLYAWENSFRDKVTKRYPAINMKSFAQVLGIRATEINFLKRLAYFNAVMTFLWTCAPVVIALASFAAFVLSGDGDHVLDASTAFVSLALFNLLRMPMNLLPMLLVQLVQCQVSLKRIDRFMNAAELDPYAVGRNSKASHAVHVDKADFAWDAVEGEKVKSNLTDIDLQVADGLLVAVVGPVGAGKSSLLNALLGEMERVKGNVNIRGKVCYVPQVAWIQNGTVRYNITFGEPYERRKYDKVLSVCALRPDLATLPGGDQAEIGERGINLSGGQKQRLSLARATYSEGDVYLLDDPLSAVDAHVGAHLFAQVVGPGGMLDDKTRILVTHSARFLPKCDRIVVMKDGGISEAGTYPELLAAGGEFADFLIQYLADEKEANNGGEGEEGQDRRLSVMSGSELEELAQNLEAALGAERFHRQLSVAKTRSRSATSGTASTTSNVPFKVGGFQPRSRQNAERSHNPPKRRVSHVSALSSGGLAKPGDPCLLASDDEKEVMDGVEGRELSPGQALIEAEQAEEGSVKLTVYAYYSKSVGIWMCVMTVVMFFIFQGFSAGSSIWLSAWSTDPLASVDDGVRDKYLAVYGVLGIFQGVAVMIAAMALSIGCLNAASRLHEAMLNRVLRAPMSFFDTTPLGRILNRFSKDIDVVDVVLPMIIRGLMTQLLTVLGKVEVILSPKMPFLFQAPSSSYASPIPSSSAS